MSSRKPWPPRMLLVLGAATALAYGFQSAKESALVAEMEDAIARVKRIVNQPVPALPRPPDAEVAVFGPGGWFHAGAAKPNFLSVDVGKTQELPYDRFEYVTSDLNPGLMFRGRNLEFNSMTKYFYTDRSLPKKRLAPAEMAEINRLYRIIGAREQELALLRGESASSGPAAAPARRATAAAAAPGEAAAQPMPTGINVAEGALLAALAIVLYRGRRSRPAGRD